MFKQLYLSLLIGLLFVIPAESRIRLRKVKEPPRVCATMKEDGLLSRMDKPVFATERHSLVVSDDITLVNDLGVKICTWKLEQFSGFGDLGKFVYYIDEFKEFLYPHIKTEDNSYLLLRVPLKDCALDDRVTLASLDFPKCEKPVKKSKKRKKKK